MPRSRYRAAPSLRRLGLLVPFLLAASLGGPAGALTLLPDEADLPKTVKEINAGPIATHALRDYVGEKTRYREDVTCPTAGCSFPAGTKVGEVVFDFAAYTGIRLPYTSGGVEIPGDPPGGPDTIGGAALLGGFILDDPHSVKAGWKLRWLQVYTETIEGAADVSRVDGSPFYPNFKRDGFDALLWDAPFDLLTRDITLNFEAALVCVNCSDEDDVKWIGAFNWGYTIDDGAVTGAPPGAWGSPSKRFLDTVAGAYADMDLEAGCCLNTVPLPPALPLLLAGAATLAVLRRVRAAPIRAAA